MSANDTTYQLILDSIGIKSFIMPEGYFPDVEIHCWGAGGGSVSSQLGGSAGYARTTININPGDEVVLQVGQPGLSTGPGGIDNSYRILRGGNGSGGAGGGGASWVVVEDTMVCCGGGGGGGGAASGGAGSPGGNTAKGLAKDSRGGDGDGGGGGGGFPRGGIASNQGGGGGQNFGNLTIAGSGTIPGGRATAYYPGDKRGEAGYPGYVILILRKKFNAFIKNPDASGDWKMISSPFVKIPIRQVPGFREVPDQTIVYSSLGTTKATVPPFVFSITVTGHGGAGGGGGADGGSNFKGGGGGGGGANRISQTFAVTPGQVLDITVGRGGAGGGGPYGTGGTGGTSTVTGTGVSFTAGGGTGGTGGGNSGTGFGGIGANGANYTSSFRVNAGGTSTNGGANGGNGGATKNAAGAAGQNGKVTVLYTGGLEPITITTGGWKPIQQAFVKVSDNWKPILTDKPIELYNYIPKRNPVTINIVVPTYDFVVYNALPIPYLEGLMDVNVYVAANTTVGSTGVTTPAFLVNQFANGDTVKISNYGNIAGRGGDGGAAGSYSTVTSGGSKAPAKGQPAPKGGYTVATTTVNSVPGRPGQFGGAGLRLDYSTLIENYGTIAGGGGGGGGGGGPTGGQGGGGAGAVPGNGGNNGTSTAGGAGLGLGGAGAARGTRGTNGTNNSNSGGLGGAAGPAVVGILNATFTVTGTRIGPLT
jgi:hypothetical protein